MTCCAIGIDLPTKRISSRSQTDLSNDLTFEDGSQQASH
jgi:hypothetical protein